jgi:hypothetical protein
VSLGGQREEQGDDSVSCPRRAQEGVSSAIEQDERGRATAFAPARRATVAESRVPLLIFLLVIILTLAISSMIIEDPYTKLQAIQHWPEVQVSSRDLVDECGVFMWVRWVGPGFGSEAPYIPMRYRYR